MHDYGEQVGNYHVITQQVFLMHLQAYSRGKQ